LVWSINALIAYWASRSHKIVNVASSNSPHRETPQGPVIKEGQHPFELRSLCMHTVLPVEVYGRGNTNREMVESTHGGILAEKSHTLGNWLWRPLHTYDLVGTKLTGKPIRAFILRTKVQNYNLCCGPKSELT